ncbi:MAG: hypothetical protein ABI416_10670 [Ginsengibacter sp.]
MNAVIMDNVDLGDNCFVMCPENSTITFIKPFRLNTRFSFLRETALNAPLIHLFTICLLITIRLVHHIAAQSAVLMC